ncbi:MAG: shikimate kinase [Flavobacteriales bacterium]
MVNKPIFLIGMMGSGKSTVGSELAKRFNLSFIDTDAQIMFEEGRSVNSIFEEQGEAYFRLLEKKQIDQVLDNACVVACGGGLPCHGNLMAQLLAKGTVVYLKASAAVLYERCQNDTARPLRRDFSSFQSLFNDRVAIYEKAPIVVDAAQTIDEIVVEINGRLSVS